MSDENPYAPNQEEILEDLRRVGEEHGKRLTIAEYNQHGRYSYSYIRDYLGPFTEALRQAGLFPTQNIRREDAIRAVEELGAELGHPPVQEEMDNQGVYSHTTILDKVGSWQEALQEAGFTEAEIHNRLIKVDTKELIDELQRIAAKLGHPPTQVDINAHSEYLYKTYYRRFGDLKTARREAGLPEGKEAKQPKQISAKDLLEELQELAEDLGHPPTKAEIDELSTYSKSTYYNRFDSFESAYRKAGLPPPDTQSPTSDNPSRLDLLTELLGINQDLDRPVTPEDVEKLSRYSVGQYEDEFGSIRAALEDAGVAE